MKLLVCGGRDYTNKEALYTILNGIALEHPIEMVVQGGANGADYLAHRWAVDNAIPSLTVPANWARDGKSAGPIRNRKMLTYGPNMVVAFKGGRGTANMVEQAEARGIEVVKIWGTVP
jgi:hypothetical protein